MTFVWLLCALWDASTIEHSVHRLFYAISSDFLRKNNVFVLISKQIDLAQLDWSAQFWARASALACKSGDFTISIWPIILLMGPQMLKGPNWILFQARRTHPVSIIYFLCIYFAPSMSGWTRERRFCSLTNKNISLNKNFETAVLLCGCRIF